MVSQASSSSDSQSLFCAFFGGSTGLVFLSLFSPFLRGNLMPICSSTFLFPTCMTHWIEQQVQGPTVNENQREPEREKGKESHVDAFLGNQNSTLLRTKYIATDVIILIPY